MRMKMINLNSPLVNEIVDILKIERPDQALSFKVVVEATLRIYKEKILEKTKERGDLDDIDFVKYIINEVDRKNEL